MFNVSQLYEIPQFLRANFQEVNYNEEAFITITGGKNRDRRFFDHVSCRISEKHKHLQRKVGKWLARAPAKNLNEKSNLDLNAKNLILTSSEKSLVFVTIRHRKFHLYLQLSYTKISYLCNNTHLRKDAAFLHLRLKES